MGEVSVFVDCGLRLWLEFDGGLVKGSVRSMVGRNWTGRDGRWLSLVEVTYCWSKVVCVLVWIAVVSELEGALGWVNEVDGSWYHGMCRCLR